MAKKIFVCGINAGDRHKSHRETLERTEDAANKKHGYTDGCEGCRRQRVGIKDHREHTEECRQRMEAEIQKTPRGMARMQDYERKLADEIEARVIRKTRLQKLRVCMSL